MNKQLEEKIYELALYDVIVAHGLKIMQERNLTWEDTLAGIVIILSETKKNTVDQLIRMVQNEKY
jgi:hypothetical protein